MSDLGEGAHSVSRAYLSDENHPRESQVLPPITRIAFILAENYRMAPYPGFSHEVRAMNTRHFHMNDVFY